MKIELSHILGDIWRNLGAFFQSNQDTLIPGRAGKCFRKYKLCRQLYKLSCPSCPKDLSRLTVPQPCCQGLLQPPGSRQSSNLSLIRRLRRRQRRRHRRRRRPRHRQPQPGLHNRNWLVSMYFSCEL